MSKRVKQSRVIHTDDTPVPIQSPGQKKCRQGRIWCYLGDEANPYTVYDYTPSRSRDGPARWLAGYAGYLQADAYGGYDGIYHQENVTEVACWAHARRKFYDAQDSDGERAAELLALVGELYAVERAAKDADDQTRLALRQARSMPTLARIQAWLDAEGQVVSPRSPLGTAITYAQNQWQALCVYTTQGFLAIDNNASERALKRVAIGRKNSYDLLSTLIAHRVRNWAQGPCCETVRRWRRAASPACIDGRSNSYSGIGYPRMKVRRAGCPRSGCCGRNTEFLTRVPFTAPATRALRSDTTRRLAPLRARSATEHAARSTT
jgi:hypothetical protein